MYTYKRRGQSNIRYINTYIRVVKTHESKGNHKPYTRRTGTYRYSYISYWCSLIDNDSFLTILFWLWLLVL